ncbi:Beta-glucuronidase [Lacunisphaera limnophila]|uniref:Beta-glucuronidase n=1 Tax=Lacunisphaera limnophila TaxID=1838286 RepID=A0A1I7PHJ6_9BACT|nr:glycoside hydrolase family 2 TIM barrel-domain containing protein [Lacunisphaera limnophila]AOS43080.1 Beta-glucuronidase [Lacunisphaera limnophila]
MQSLLRPLVLALAALTGLVAPATPLINAADREVLALNGRWHVIVDPYDNGYVNYRLQRFDEATKPSGGYFLDRKPATPAELIEYDFDTSASLNVPGDWNSQDDKLLYYESTVWYRKRFDYTPRAAGARQFLHFGGANYEADVYLNGAKLGRHVGGFTPFEFEVTGKLKPTGNSLVVRVNNARRPEAVPTVNTDWWNYGGLTRDVRLLETPATAIRDFALRLQPGADRRVRGFVQLDGPGQPVTVEIPELKIAVAATADAAGRATFEFALTGAELWSPESPRLYAVTLTAGADRLTDRVGFRTIETRGADILLNGKSTFLRGISLHEENPLRGGRATTPADARQLLGWAQELGCNYVRLAHYPHNEHMARVADELGILLWAEVPVYWTIHWDNADTYANAENQLTELITRDRNRASVIIWSMANETPISPARTVFLKKLVAHTRALDPTRLISAAMERHSPADDPSTSIVEDELAEVTDLVSFNQYIGWYVGMPDDCAKAKWIINYNKPVIVSEFGADALQGLHGDRRARFTEEFQADLYAQTLTMLEKIPQLRGMTPWILCDFRSPRRHLPNIQDGWNRKGLIGENGTRKMAFGVLQEYYARKAAAYAKP